MDRDSSESDRAGSETAQLAFASTIRWSALSSHVAADPTNRKRSFNMFYEEAEFVKHAGYFGLAARLLQIGSAVEGHLPKWREAEQLKAKRDPEKEPTALPKRKFGALSGLDEICEELQSLKDWATIKPTERESSPTRPSPLGSPLAGSQKRRTVAFDGRESGDSDGSLDSGVSITRHAESVDSAVEEEERQAIVKDAIERAKKLANEAFHA